MNHILALSHVLSAGTALALAGTVVMARTRRRDRRPSVPRRTMRRLALVGLHLLLRLLWSVLYVMGRPVANRRYGLVDPLLGPFEALLTARNHRLAHAACVPIPTAPHWLLRCRTCRAWVLLREVPALGGVGLDLHIVSGSLDGTLPCPARYLGGRTAPSSRPTTSSARPPSTP